MLKHITLFVAGFMLGRSLICFLREEYKEASVCAMVSAVSAIIVIIATS